MPYTCYMATLPYAYTDVSGSPLAWYTWYHMYNHFRTELLSALHHTDTFSLLSLDTVNKQF